jgi:hypothetical protein
MGVGGQKASSLRIKCTSKPKPIETGIEIGIEMRSKKKKRRDVSDRLTRREEGKEMRSEKEK